jgi:hypothetical protein
LLVMKEFEADMALGSSSGIDRERRLIVKGVP